MELMLFTNNVSLAKEAFDAKIDRIVIDLEKRKKDERQHGYHLEINNHKIEDIIKIKNTIPIKIMCRLNPYYENSKNEIEQALIAGADILMLPMFKTFKEVNNFINIVDNRAKISLLFETKESILCIDQFKDIEVNEIYIGLNDLSLSYDINFQYEFISNGIIDYVREKFAEYSLGFGGITILNKGFPLPTKDIIQELARINAKQVILRRSFKKDVMDKNLIKEVSLLKNYYEICKIRKNSEILEDHLNTINKIKDISETIRS